MQKLDSGINRSMDHKPMSRVAIANRFDLAKKSEDVSTSNGFPNIRTFISKKNNSLINQSVMVDTKASPLNPMMKIEDELLNTRKASLAVPIEHSVFYLSQP